VLKHLTRAEIVVNIEEEEVAVFRGIKILLKVHCWSEDDLWHVNIDMIYRDDLCRCHGVVPRLVSSSDWHEIF